MQPKKLTTISHHIDAEQNLHPEATGDFTSILNDLTLALRIISRDVRRAGLNDVLGLTRDTNVHGEQVRKLDTYSNEVIKRAMQNSGHICIMASEEDDDIILTSPGGGKAKYVLVFDPLDGSSNIDVNVTIGTIFGLYKRVDPISDEPGTVEDVIQAGYKLEAAGYSLYGSSTMLVYTTGHGVHSFTYDPTLGEFLLTNENIRLPKRGKYYSANEGYFYRWSENMKQYIEYIKTPSSDKSRPYSLRYIGTAVADIHRTLLTGGIYLYPADSSMPNGKLRIVYEANALAMIIEQAGGRATDGERRILDIKPDSIHQRVPFIAGSKDDVIECESFLKGEHPLQKIF
ncbi:MAG: class 1 fructose-bisphosphatase [Candidatus Kapabacteria bacterium]|nr:class 1 fructose-bisphosphatase [Ignavibacteriota bacterium]MCW5885488.1 class 1 fructose-bisphosphatase [Candidatus Kapabacteria bacterium]